MTAWHNAPSDYVGVPVACSTGAIHTVQVRYNGTTLQTRVDGGAWSDQTRANAAAGVLAQLPVVGVNYTTTAFFNGRIFDIIIAGYAMTDEEFDTVHAYYDDRYGTSFG